MELDLEKYMDQAVSLTMTYLPSVLLAIGLRLTTVKAT